ncbi:MAG: hypothetical protein IJB64_05885, partial [Akkermansia sp.]|nr:hypothetical protein [Akkermansia sp.]
KISIAISTLTAVITPVTYARLCNIAPQAPNSENSYFVYRNSYLQIAICRVFRGPRILVLARVVQIDG